MKEFDFKEVGKRMPYSVPDNFFEEMTAETLKKCAPAKESARTKPLHRGVWISMAASVAVVMLIQWGFYFQRNQEQPLESEGSSYFAALTNEEIATLADDIITEDELFYLTAY